MPSMVVEQPSHVPDELVRDFDPYNLPGLVNGYSDDIHALWKTIQDTHPDIFWTPRNGGHWVVTRYAEMAKLTTEADRFSNLEPFVPKGIIPHTGPSQMDAPEHGPFRRLVAQAFTPALLNKAGMRARAVAVDIIERLRPQGSCDFALDFAGIMPVITFLNLLGMSEDDAPYLLDLAKRNVPGQDTAQAAAAETHDYIANLIRERQVRPTDDFVSMLVSAQVMGRDLTETERHNVVQLVVTGGLETVMNTTSFAMVHFARHPELQRELRENPDLHEGAVDEISRRFGTSNIARLAKCDTELCGVAIREGDQILSIYPLSGLDERVNPEPMLFDPRRKARRHINFGSGPHTCLGARLARREIRIFLEEWIGKMPECRIAAGTQPRMAAGLINTVHGFYLEWDPA
ncbi:cytochrome P450 [Novosphingobium taihuense]|uniref:Cytochrome P450 n=1 Tax=Novosphingobium taihuense TaxID=260085 RepID=A0A7W7EUE0_9SPHN|nr:cytochrome P450 [Novosphingobium taihuense]MBB4614313.1 cytochrome P450 [Novosphingobium taihuense]